MKLTLSLQSSLTFQVVAYSISYFKAGSFLSLSKLLTEGYSSHKLTVIFFGFCILQCAQKLDPLPLLMLFKMHLVCPRHDQARLCVEFFVRLQRMRRRLVMWPPWLTLLFSRTCLKTGLMLISFSSNIILPIKLCAFNMDSRHTLV